MLNSLYIASTADRLLEAERLKWSIDSASDFWHVVDTTAAYAIQRRIIDHKIAEGHRVTGVKLGLTSPAKQHRMGVNTPLTAVITDQMALDIGTPIPLNELIHARVEPEIVFIMRNELRGPGITAEDALAAVATVHAGVEVIDSRYTDFKFTLADVIADNASSARYFVSPTGIDPTSIDLAAEEVVVSTNGEIVHTGSGADVQGHPAQALALAANSLAERGEHIPAGAIVLTGGMTDATPISPGQEVSFTFAALGPIVVTGQVQ